MTFLRHPDNNDILISRQTFKGLTMCIEQSALSWTKPLEIFVIHRFRLRKIQNKWVVEMIIPRNLPILKTLWNYE